MSAVSLPAQTEPDYDPALIHQAAAADKMASPLYQIPGRDFEIGPHTAPIEAGLDQFRRQVTLAMNARIDDLEALSRPNLAYVNAEGRIHLDVVLTDPCRHNLHLLCDLGFTLEHLVPSLSVVQGWLPCSMIGPAGELAGVKRLQLPKYAQFRSGSTLTQGDAILQADDVRTLAPPGPYNGDGIRVGVISNGVASRAAAIATGDLPPQGIIIDPNHPGSGDEGTAMLEIIHDLAPTADLYFGGVSNATEMVAIIEWLDTVADCNVICDDVGFPAEPWFEDGMVAQAARNAVVNNGKIYTSSAGNAAREHYQGAFTNDGSGFHDFKLGAGVDIGLNFTIRGNSTATLILQWSDPFGGSGNDYDLHVFTPDGSTLIGSSIASQNGNDDPIEFLSLQNNSSDDNQLIAVIQQYDGQDRILEMFVVDPVNEFIDDDATPVDSIYGHAAVEEVFSCAAINAGEPGNDAIAPYSSHGPSTIVYPESEIRSTPFITGIDGVSVTGAGGFPSTFFGTSASSPHVAAIAALLLDQDPNAAPPQIRDRLIAGALERGESGFDFIFGHGLANALHAVNAAFLTVTLDPAAGGDVADDEIIAVIGDDVTLTANPDNNLDVDTWYIDCLPVQQAGNQFTLNNLQENTAVFVTFTSGIAADLNLDTQNDLTDLLLFTGAWLSDDCCETFWCGGADLDNDGAVTLTDWAIFSGNWSELD